MMTARTRAGSAGWGRLGSLEGAARARAIAQAVADLVRPGALDGVRAIDLGAGPGTLGAELAARGASVTAVEGRAASVAAIEALGRELGLGERLQARHADVRSLDWETLGRFDVVLCSGLLYHLELNDIVALAGRMRAACERLTVVDTEVAWGPLAAESSAGRSYHGLRYREFSADATAAEKEASVRSSLDNEGSFWLTRASLHALLDDAGFASSWELGSPAQPRREQRATIVALTGERVQRLAASPEVAPPPARPAEPRLGRAMRARLAVARLRRA